MRKHLTMHALGMRPSLSLSRRRWANALLAFSACATALPAFSACATALLAFGACAIASASTAPSREDMLWLDRVTYGPTTAVVEQYLKLGRLRFLDQQLHPADL